MKYKTPQANLRAQYPRAMEKSVTVALALFLLVFLAYPSVKVTPYERMKKQEIIEVENIPETHQKKVAPPPARPSIPVESESEEVPEDVTIEETDLDLTQPPPPPPPPAPEQMEFVPYDKAPQVIKLVRPIYPEIARKAGVEGTVILKIQVDEKGNVVDAKVLKSLGAGLDEAAIAAAMQCKFTPAMQRDKSVKVWVSYPVRFVLKEAKNK